MRQFRSSHVAACAAVLALGSISSPNVKGAETDSEKTTVMTVRGKLLFHDALDQPLASHWRTAKGKWEVADGAIRGSEVPSDQHGAVTRHAVDFRNAVIQYSFKLDGAKTISLSINDAKGHLCRAVITSKGISIRKDDHDHEGPDKAAVLQSRVVPVEPGRWHTLLIEIQGPEMLARLDDQTVAFGANDGIDVDKANVGLTVAGASASFKDLRIWEARPNPDWASARAKLASAPN